MDALFGIAAAFGTAAAKSATDLGTKIASQGLDERALFVIAWMTSALLLLAAAVFTYPALLATPVAAIAAVTGSNYGWVLAADGTLNAVAFYFYIRAFKYSDASLVAPLMFLTPVFMLVTTPLMLRETISPTGIAGVLFTVLGSFMLGKTGGGASLSGGFGALVRDKGVRSMLITVAIWSVTSNLDKLGVLASTPVLWSASIALLVAAYGGAAWIAAWGAPRRVEKPWRGGFVGAGLAGQAILQNTALTLLPVPYVIAIKRTSALLTVLASGAVLKERATSRLSAALIMTLGTILMALASLSQSP